MEDLTGKQLGPYRIVAPLGEGGMAAVYKAYQPGMDRYVAMKILPRHFASDPQFVGRFEQEAKVIAKLQHPHVLPVFDYGEADGYTYIVMPFVETGTLTQLLQGKPLPLKQIRSILSQVGDALDYAHSRGIVHRDVKPSNVLIDTRGNCLLTDFGIAKIVEGTAKFTATGGVIGTPAYMSPEQGMGETVDRRSDIYSLGVILYETATGRVPFDAETPIAIVFKHINDPLLPPRRLNPALPEALERVILKALAKRPEDRYAAAADMVWALQEAIPDVRQVETAPVETPTAVSPPAAREDSGYEVAPPVEELETEVSAAPAAAMPAPRPERRRRTPAWGWILGGLAALGVIVGLLAIASGADGTVNRSVAQTAAAAGRIAFVSDRDGNEEIYIIGPDGLTRQTNNPAQDFSPAWSPDGGRLAYVSTRDGNEEIYVLGPAGVTRQTDNPARDFSPAWSPDGGRLAYVSTRDGNEEIYVTGPGGLTRQTNHPAQDFSPAWSPDGGRLAYVSTRDGNEEIYVTGPDGLMRQTNNPARDFSPAWSPDGRTIVFVSDREGNEEIYAITSAGLVRLTDHPARDFSPAWSPDGKMIAFVSDRDGNHEIYLMNVEDAFQGTDGSGPIRLTNNPANDSFPTWQP